jgi:hypothetical protein
MGKASRRKRERGNEGGNAAAGKSNRLDISEFITHEFRRKTDGAYDGDDAWRGWLRGLMPEEPSLHYLYGLVPIIESDLLERLGYAEGDRAKELKEVYDKLQSDAEFRLMFAMTVRDDVAEFALSREPSLETIRLYEAIGYDLKRIDLLHWVAESEDNSDAIPYLIERGFDVDGLNAIERTPLLVAARQENEKGIRALLEAGADTSKKDRFGKTAEELFPSLPSILSDIEAASLIKKYGDGANRSGRKGGAL